MRVLLARLAGDDRGALLSMEFLLVAAILVLGLVVGLTTLRNALATEFTAMANAVLTLNGGSGSSGASGAISSGSGATTLTDPVCTPATSVSVVGVTSPCP